MAAGPVTPILLAACFCVAACFVVSPSIAGLGADEAGEIYLPGNLPASFDFASVTHSNLGHEGPDGGYPTLHYANVSFVQGVTVDLVVSVPFTTHFGGYRAHNNSQNGIKLEFGKINARCGVDSEVFFSFIDHDSLKPVRVGSVYLSFFDVDSGSAAGLTEYVGFHEMAAHYLTETTELQLTERTWGPYWSSSTVGTGADNPQNAADMTQEQKDRSVTGLFLDTSTIVAHIGVNTPASSKGCINAGRNFFFAFHSVLVSPEHEIIDDTSPTTPECLRLDFANADVVRSNLGGKGPDVDSTPGLLFGNVATYNGKSVDFFVSVIGDYTPGNASQNGLQTGMAAINGACGSEARLQFQLVSNFDGTPINVQRLCVSFADLDTGINSACAESITVGGFKHVHLPSNSQLSIADAGAGETRFVAGARGKGSDNPTSPSDQLTPPQQSNAFELEFSGVSEFTATLAWNSLPDWREATSRNIFFGGSANFQSAYFQNSEAS